jgi:hypothetical protein
MVRRSASRPHRTRSSLIHHLCEYTGSHPSLLHLHQILQDRRVNLLHLAQLRLKQNELELVRVRESDKKAVMSWWQVSVRSGVGATRVWTADESSLSRMQRIHKADYEMVRPRESRMSLPTRLVAGLSTDMLRECPQHQELSRPRYPPGRMRKQEHTLGRRVQASLH